MRKFVKITKKTSIWQETIHWIRQVEVKNSKIFNWRFTSNRKSEKKKKQKRHLQEKIYKNDQKIENLRTENSLNSNSNHREKRRIQWWIQRYSIEDANRSENWRKKETKKTFGRENFEELHEIWQFQKRKFTQFQFKSQGEMQNSMVNLTIFHWRCKSKRKSEKKRNKKHICKRKFRRITQNWQFDNRKFTQWEFKSQSETQNSMVNSTIFVWRFRSKRKSERKRNKKHIWKRKFRRITKSLAIWQQKIHSIRVQVTGRNAKFNDELNDIRLKIQIEAKIREKRKQKTHLEEKISKNYKKFDNLTTENSLNSSSNHRGECRIQRWTQRYSIEDSNRSENQREKETKKTVGSEHL